MGEGLPAITGDSQVRLQIAETLLREQAEGRAAADNGGLGAGADLVDHLLGDRQRPLRVHVAAVIQIPQGYAHQIGLELLDGLLGVSEIVIGKHQVQNLELVPLRV